MKAAAYFHALRPWLLSASFTPSLVGASLAYAVKGQCSIFILFVTCVTTMSLHAAGNLVNTYYDYLRGVDKEKSDDRTLVEGILSPDEVVSLASFVYGLACIGFLVIVLTSPAQLEHLALAYFGGLSSSFLYTGGVGLKYIALGDAVVIVIFGPITVVFSYLAQSGEVAWCNLLYSIPLALSAEAAVHCNNTKNLTRDKGLGIVTLAILLGPILSKLAYGILLLVPYLMVTVTTVRLNSRFILPLLTIPWAFKMARELLSDSPRTLPKRTAKLNLVFGLLFSLSIALCTRENLPFADF